jgi:putative phosphoribosyl transferase
VAEVKINSDGGAASGGVTLEGTLTMPEGASGIVLFAHGSGSSRFSPRNRFVADTIRAAKVGTLLFDLLTRSEETLDARTGHLRFDIDFLAARLRDATRWVREQLTDVRIGYFGSSTGGGAALVAAADEGEQIRAVVSRGGRPDLAGAALARVRSPTLLIVGGLDELVISLNQHAFNQLDCMKELQVIPGATHLFEEPGTLEQVAALAADWFKRYLAA